MKHLGRFVEFDRDVKDAVFALDAVRGGRCGGVNVYFFLSSLSVKTSRSFERDSRHIT